jgi:exosortase A
MKQEQGITGSGSQHNSNMAFPISGLHWLVGVLFLWALVFYQGLMSAIDVWVSSDVFNHCLFVLPGSAYLIYLKRNEVMAHKVKPNFWVLIAIVPLLLLYAIGTAGDVQLFMHGAMFTILPLLIWLVLGNGVAKEILFPLVFILFCIPVGEELVPFLQHIAAVFSVKLLELSGIPVFSSGLYIEIPKGRFLVAEACSGISFFIASLVIGCLYAYLNMRSGLRRSLFILLSVIFPIAANILRVYGIIIIAHVSDMKYAVGADHLIYGWFFFAFVIVCLIALGEWLREKGAVSTPVATNKPQLDFKQARNAVLLVSACLLMSAAWYKLIEQGLTPAKTQTVSLGLATDLTVLPDDMKLPWYTTFKRADVSRYSQLIIDDHKVTIYQAIYAPGGAEMINARYRLYDQDSWTIVESEVVKSQGQTYLLETLSNPVGNLRYLASWYIIGEQTFANKQQAKFAQIKSALLGETEIRGILAVSLPVTSLVATEDKALLNTTVAKWYQRLNLQMQGENQEGGQ